MMGLWQIKIIFNLPFLVARYPVLTLYRRGVHAVSFELSDLSIAESNISIGLALVALVVTSAILTALGISNDLARSWSLHLSSTQRLIMRMTGFWFAGGAFSLSYLDFPRRKLLLRGASKCSVVIYLDSRKQRHQLLASLRALQLKEVMWRVGLGLYDPTI
jgi:hypothetical protein